jgi:hypothetical protein
MAFKMSPSLHQAGQILGFLLRRLKRCETQNLNNAFSKEAKLNNYAFAGAVRTTA